MISMPRPAALAAPSTALLLSAACTLSLAGPAQAQDVAADAPALVTLFDAAPAGAEVVWAVPTLRGFSDRVAAFAAETGIEVHAPDFADALGAIKREMGLPQGLDDDGSLLVAVTGLATAMEAQLDDDPGNDNIEPSAVLLVPVSDYNAFITGLGGDPAADTTAVTLNRNQGFARKVPGYAVIAPTAQAAAAYAPGAGGAVVAQAVGPHAAPWFEDGQSLVYIDVAALAPTLKAAIALGMDEMQNELQNGDPTQAALMAPMMTAYAGLANGMIDGTDKLALTLDLDAEGLGVTMGGRLNDGSDLASMLRAPGQDGAAEGQPPLLTRLPDQPFLFAAAADLTRWDTEALGEAVRGVAAELKDAAGDADADAVGGLPIEQMVDLYTEMMQVAPDANAMGSVMYAPDAAAMMSGGFFNQLSVTQTPNADATLDRQKAVMAKMNDLKIPMPAMNGGAAPADGAANEMSFETTYTENALEIDGTRVDQFQVKTVLPPALMQQFGPMAMVMGNAGTGGYLAAKDGYVLSTTVTDAQLVSRGLAALKTDDGLGATASLANLRDSQLPQDASMEAWLSVRGIANTVNPFLLMFAPGGGQLNVPADLSPIAMGGAGDPEGMVLRLFVPTDVVRFGVDTLDQFAPKPIDNEPGDRGRRAPRAL